MIPAWGGYVVDLNRSEASRMLRATVRTARDPWKDRDYGRSIYDYYGAPYPYG